MLHKDAGTHEDQGTLLLDTQVVTTLCCLTMFQLDNYIIHLASDPSYWKLVHKSMSAEAIEGVFQIRGILCMASLPPVKDKR